MLRFPIAGIPRGANKNQTILSGTETPKVAEDIQTRTAVVCQVAAHMLGQPCGALPFENINSDCSTTEQVQCQW